MGLAELVPPNGRKDSMWRRALQLFAAPHEDVEQLKSQRQGADDPKHLKRSCALDVEPRVAFEKFAGDRVIGVTGEDRAAGSEFVRGRDATKGGVPGEGESAGCDEAGGKAAETDCTQRETTKRQQSGTESAERNDPEACAAHADAAHGKGAAGEKNSIGLLAAGNPADRGLRFLAGQSA